MSSFFFFFNDTATTEIYTLSLHDALPIYSSPSPMPWRDRGGPRNIHAHHARVAVSVSATRSEEHTSELQSRRDLVCRLLLEKKKKQPNSTPQRATDLHGAHRLVIGISCSR